MKYRLFFFAAALLLVTGKVMAQNSWQIRTPSDSFTIEVINGTTGKIGDKEVSLKPFAKFVKILTGKNFAAECIVPKKKANISITQTRGSEIRNWQLYAAEAVFYDGAHCLSVGGEGVGEFPLHRSWFLNQGSQKIELGKRFSIVVGTDTMNFVLSENGQWKNADASVSTNFSLVDNFTNAAKDFEVAHHTSQPSEPNAESFVLKTAGKSYRFVRVGDDFGIQLESPKWLAITPSFRFIKDLTLAAWQNESNSELATVKKSDAPANERIALIKKLSVQWNDDIKHALQTIILAREENVEVKRSASQILKYHPTDDNILALAHALLKTEDNDLLFVMTDALRVRNPKGPRISTTDQPADVEKKIQEWQKWVNELQAIPKK